MSKPRLTYAGIGNRDTPDEILELMTKIASRLAVHGYTLMSGGAKGADNAFESGTAFKRVWTVKDMTSMHGQPGYEAHRKTAIDHHPAWWRINSPYVQDLFVRNVYIVRGTQYWPSASFIICYCKDENKGGTAHSLKVARDVNIPVYNLAKGDPQDVLKTLGIDFGLIPREPLPSPFSDQCYHAHDERCEHCEDTPDEAFINYFGEHTANLYGII